MKAQPKAYHAIRHHATVRRSFDDPSLREYQDIEVLRVPGPSLSQLELCRVGSRTAHEQSANTYDPSLEFTLRMSVASGYPIVASDSSRFPCTSVRRRYTTAERQYGCDDNSLWTTCKPCGTHVMKNLPPPKRGQRSTAPSEEGAMSDFGRSATCPIFAVQLSHRTTDAKSARWRTTRVHQCELDGAARNPLPLAWSAAQIIRRITQCTPDFAHCSKNNRAVGTQHQRSAMSIR